MGGPTEADCSILIMARMTGLEYEIALTKQKHVTLQGLERDCRLNLPVSVEYPKDKIPFTRNSNKDQVPYRPCRRPPPNKTVYDIVIPQSAAGNPDWSVGPPYFCERKPETFLDKTIKTLCGTGSCFATKDKIREVATPVPVVLVPTQRSYRLHQFAKRHPSPRLEDIKSLPCSVASTPEPEPRNPGEKKNDKSDKTSPR